MRRILLSLAILAALLTGAAAAPMQSQVATNYVDLTIGASAVGFTSSDILLDGTTKVSECSGRLEVASVRYRYDGGAPTASAGELVNPGDRITIKGYANLAAFRAIRTGGSSGVFRGHCVR